MIQLTSENYFSQQANLEYMSCSQFKSFCDCEERTLADIAGDYKRDSSTALLVGSYVDAHFEGTLDVFKAQHPELFKRDGTLKADYVQAESIIQRVENDKLFMKYMAGEKQVIMTGKIADVPYKIKIDSYHPDKAIVDLKVVKDFEKLWNDTEKQKQSFIRYWGYDIQGAIYQEIVRQNTGKKLPFFIAAATKEKHTDFNVFAVPQEWLDEKLAFVEERTPHFARLKTVEEPAERCERCDWCKDTKILDRIVDVRDLEDTNA